MTLDPISAIKLSLLVGTFSVLFAFPFALGFGWLLARKSFFGKTLLTLILFLPLSLPPVVTGLLLLSLVGRNTVLGSFFSELGYSLTFSFEGAVLASLVVGFPLYVMMVRSAIESADIRYEQMAKTLGLSSLQTFFKVTLPLAAPGVFAGTVIAFARALGEFGATAIVAGNMEGETRTISLALYSLMESPGGEEESRILLLASVALSAAALIAYEVLIKYHRKRLELNP